MLNHHLPPYEKLKSWLTSRNVPAKSTMTSDSPFWKASRLGRKLLFSKTETPNRSRESYLDIERNNPGRFTPDALSSHYEQGLTKNSVRTYINSGTENLIEDDGIHCDIELQQHSQQYGSR